MYTLLYVYIAVYIHCRMYTLPYVYIAICIHCYMYTLLYVYIAVCIHCCMYTLLYVYIAVCIHCCMYTLLYVYIAVCIHCCMSLIVITVTLFREKCGSELDSVGHLVRRVQKRVQLFRVHLCHIREWSCIDNGQRDSLESGHLLIMGRETVQRTVIY